MTVKFRDIVPQHIKFNKVDFPDNQYYKDKTQKSQVCWHGTASGRGISGDLKHWLGSTARVATPTVIARDGTINSFFHGDYWAHHLGIKKAHFREFFKDNDKKYNTYKYTNEALNQSCIGIELDNWGYVIKGEDGKFRSWAGTIVEPDNVQYFETAFRGHHYYEKLTSHQLESLKYLTAYYLIKYEIYYYELTSPKQIIDILFSQNETAISGEEGIYTHCSYRSDKYDIAPHPELIDILDDIYVIVENYRCEHEY